MSDTSSTNPCEIDCCLLPPGSAATIWAALADDTASFLLVIDEDGLVVCCNDLVNEQIGADHAPLQGKQVSMFCSESVANECRSAIQGAIKSNRPTNIVGMCQGVATRSSVRPLPEIEGQKRLALKIVRPLNDLDVHEMKSGKGVWLTATSFDLGKLSVLTTRELEVLRLIGESMTTAEIADHLHRSVKTIEWHRVSLGSKLGASNRVELARIAASAGLQFLENDTFAKICKLSAAEQAVHPF